MPYRTSKYIKLLLFFIITLAFIQKALSKVNGQTAIVFDELYSDSENFFDQVVSASNDSYQQYEENINAEDDERLTALMQASSYGQRENVLEHLKSGANVNYITLKQTTALMYAVKNGYYPITIDLLNYGANIHLKDKDGNTAFLHACHQLNLKIINVLLGYGSNANEKNYLGKNCLIMALSDDSPNNAESFLELVYLLRSFDMDLNAKEYQYGDTLTILTAHRGIFHHVGSHLNKLGAHINFINEQGLSPLMVAVLSGDEEPNQYSEEQQLENVKALIELGANQDIRNHLGWSAFHTACLLGKTEIALYLQEQKPNLISNIRSTGLMFAAQFGQTDTARALVTNYVKTNNQQNIEKAIRHIIDIKNVNGWTALMYAASHGQDETLTYLLEQSASKGLRNNEGQNALMLYVATGNYKSIASLLDYNANTTQKKEISKLILEFVNIKDEFGMTALLYAVTSGQTKVVTELLEYGAEIETTDNTGLSAIIHILAAENERIFTIALYHDKKLENTFLEIETEEKQLEFLENTALSLKISMIKTLIEHGVNINKRLAYPPLPTAIIAASAECDTDGVSLLLEHDADVTILDSDNKSLLFYANQCEDKKVIDIISSYTNEKGITLNI